MAQTPRRVYTPTAPLPDGCERQRRLVSPTTVADSCANPWREMRNVVIAVGIDQTL